MLPVPTKKSRTFVVAVFCFLLCVGEYLSSGIVMAASGKPNESATLPVVVHYQSATCGSIVESHWLSSQQQYESIFQAMYEGLIADSMPQPVQINFDRQSVLLISMGQQRTGGYSVKLASAKMEVANERAKIQVQWNVKKPGMIAIQMLTNPCLLLEIPGGNYKFIDVVDQSGVTRQSFAVNQGDN